MENDEKQALLDEQNRQLQEIVKLVGLTAERILSYAKLRISANERLTLLASGVLTLTFSGAVSLYGRPNFHLPVQVLQPLLWAWKLLIFAIVCCIIANSREGRAASIFDTELSRHEFWARNASLQALSNRLNPSTSKPLASAPVHGKKGEMHETFAGLCGWLARVSTVVAFVLLYVFVRRLIVQL